MSAAPRCALNLATAAQVEEHLRRCDRHFMPPLSERVDLTGYAHKLTERAQCFEAWTDDCLVGLVAAYFCNAIASTAHISNVSVLPQCAGQGIASTLLGRCIEHARDRGVSAIGLEVSADNAVALRIYAKAGFEPLDANGAMRTLQLQLGERHA